MRRAFLILASGLLVSCGGSVGASCEKNSDCLSGSCTDSGFCGAARTCHCVKDGDCPRGQVCITFPDCGPRCDFPQPNG
ncbi:MAG: hypothetical protein JST54_12940 [Deltaproteobacteria bacterium]|nr:hypothetical protein [Deltaproteobacteria bacterium]